MKRKLTVMGLLAMCFLTACATGSQNGSAGENVTENTEMGNEVILGAEDYDYRDYVTIKNYKDFTVDVPSAEVTDADVEEELQNLRVAHVEYEPMEKEKAEDGDYVNVTYSRVTIDGNENPNYITDGYEMRIGQGVNFEQLENKIKEMTVGETKDITVDVVSDYYDTNLAGKRVVYSVTLNSIDREVIPEVTDDWISSVSKYDTVNEWKEAIKSNLIVTKKQEQEQVFFDGIKDAVKENTEFKTLPVELVESMVAQYKAEDEKNAATLGYDFNDFITSYYGYADNDSYESDLRTYVEQSVQMEFLLAALQDAENISVSESDRKAFIDECLVYYEFETEDSLLDYYGEDVVEAACLNNTTWKVISKYSTMNVLENYETSKAEEEE